MAYNHALLQAFDQLDIELAQSVAKSEGLSASDVLDTMASHQAVLRSFGDEGLMGNTASQWRNWASELSQSPVTSIDDRLARTKARYTALEEAETASAIHDGLNAKAAAKGADLQGGQVAGFRAALQGARWLMTTLGSATPNMGELPKLSAADITEDHQLLHGALAKAKARSQDQLDTLVVDEQGLVGQVTRAPSLIQKFASLAGWRSTRTQGDPAAAPQSKEAPRP